MLTTDIAIYFVLLVSLTLAPGPLMAVMVSRTMGNDARGAIGFGVGIAIGDVIAIALICAGLGATIQAMPQLFNIGKALGTVYILWVAYGIWKGAIDVTERPMSRKSSTLLAIAAGAGTCIATPQTIILYLMLLPGLVDVNSVDAAAFFSLSLVTFLALALTFTCVVVLASWLRRQLDKADRMVWINRCLAFVVAISGVWMMLS